MLHMMPEGVSANGSVLAACSCAHAATARGWVPPGGSHVRVQVAGAAPEPASTRTCKDVVAAAADGPPPVTAGAPELTAQPDSTARASTAITADSDHSRARAAGGGVEGVEGVEGVDNVDGIDGIEDSAG